MAEQVKAGAALPDDLSLIPGTRGGMREPTVSTCPLTFTRTRCHACMHAHALVNTGTSINEHIHTPIHHLKHLQEKALVSMIVSQDTFCQSFLPCETSQLNSPHLQDHAMVGWSLFNTLSLWVARLTATDL